MSAILKFDFQKKKQLRFSEVNYLNYTKWPNCACDNYIFPKTGRNKNKQWTHSTPLKHDLCKFYETNFQFEKKREKKDKIAFGLMAMSVPNSLFKKKT